MKKVASLLVLLSLGMFTVGCGDTTTTPPATPPATTPDDAPGDTTDPIDDGTAPDATPEPNADGTTPPEGENQ